MPANGRFSYETWIIPKKHFTYFENSTDDELVDFAEVILKTIQSLNNTLKAPSFNLIFQNGTYDFEDKSFFHWYIQIFPRTYHLAGFEWATGLYINPVEPETAALQLKKNISQRGKNEAI